MKKSILLQCIGYAFQKFNPMHPAWDFKSVHFSFIIQNNKILGVGFNRPKTAMPKCFGYHEHAAIHSEVDAWRKVKGIIDKKQSWEIINLRMGYSKSLIVAEPCARCYEFLEQHGCKHIYFSTDEGKISKTII